MKLATLLNWPKAMVATVALSLSLFSVSCGDSNFNLSIPGVKGPTVSLIEDNVLVSMVFENISIDGGLRYAIPKYNYSYLEISPDLQSGGTLFAAYISLQDLFHGNLHLLPPQYLPGGRPLPGVLNGRLPAVAFSIEKFYNIAFYVGNNIFGIFVPVKMDIGSTIITARFYIGKKRSGNISVVGPDEQGQNSGVLLLLDLSTTQVNQLKSYSKKF
jgi:hypothetical protein